MNRNHEFTPSSTNAHTATGFQHRLSGMAVVLALAFGALPAARAAEPGSTAAAMAQMRQEIDALKQDYEARIRALENRLMEAERRASAPAAPAASVTASPGSVTAAATAPDTASGAPRPRSNAFNPAVSLVLTGQYAQLQRDPESWRLNGFATGDGEIGPGDKGFGLGESEITFSASIDPWWNGSLTLALSPENEVELEEAWVQNAGLVDGLSIKAGRFFSSLGYLNEQHRHVWDFIEAPLAMQAFFGGQYGQDGVQARYVLPTATLIEFGAEAGRGDGHPGTGTGRNGAGATSVFTRLGGDLGTDQSWRLGLAHLWTRAQDRGFEEELPEIGLARYTGNSRIWVADAVWKWTPGGSASGQALKLQGEYFHRTEDGRSTLGLDAADPTVTGTDARWRTNQSGWYAQGVWQFMPRWRTGLRHERLDTGRVRIDDLRLPFSHDPSRTSVLLDWQPSEFSRWRLQINDDRVRDGVKDTQVVLQYQMNLGAHGAHGF